MESLGTSGRRGHRLNEDIRLDDEELEEAEEFEEALVTAGGAEAEAEDELDIHGSHTAGSSDADEESTVAEEPASEAEPENDEEIPIGNGAPLELDEEDPADEDEEDADEK